MGDIGPAQQRFEVLPVPVLSSGEVRRRPGRDQPAEPADGAHRPTRDDSPSQH
jgi:hypothetical protein